MIGAKRFRCALVGCPLTYPADIVVSTHNFNTPFHFHALPVLNVYIASAGLAHHEETHAGKLGSPLRADRMQIRLKRMRRTPAVARSGTQTIFSAWSPPTARTPIKQARSCGRGAPMPLSR